ncbi:MAG: hypothetical protein AAF585_17280 [Verrucomicrobiota bacterium]
MIPRLVVLILGFACLGCIFADTPEYDWKPRETRKKHQPILTALRDYNSVMYDFARMPSKVKEYQLPAGMFTESGKVKNLGYRNSEEGIHVGSRKNFTDADRRAKYSRITVEFDGLYCDYYGEDAFTVDPLAKAIIRKGQWKGRRSSGSDRNPGNDKCFQVDGGRLELRAKYKGAIIIENAKHAVRGKANSIIIVDGVDFVDCERCVVGDGKRNPPSKSARYFNGAPGRCLILVKNCRFWNCKTLVQADENCYIYWSGSNQVIGRRGSIKDEGGTIKRGADLTERFYEEVEKLYRQDSNEW